MQVLITGAAGRIGRTLAAGLTGYRLELTDIVAADFGGDPAPMTLCDLASDDLTAIVRDVDAVVHLAGHPNSRDWAVVEHANLVASRRLAEAAAVAGVRRFVYASSIHVAGFLAADTEFSDDVPYRPDSPYGVSKAAAEMMLRYISEQHAMSAVALRIGSFRPAPQNARELRTWISPGDMVRLADAALRADMTGFLPVWGLSNNRRAGVRSENWRKLGYHPMDDAENYATALAGAGVPTHLVSEWPHLGGNVIVR
ncbi:NAD-dependent epimerase/dehydratase family protein [Sphingomonas sp. SFZ2018-12]|uniref:NAD-dependent epimerase/dehydratase family protein n=1 Tax=Sphingomonas sp. SFZ2018-12 TaxID=2683197 RepID=UPI001F0FF0D2|nr:NAD(P)-dependent oxidoreductase [Sphingomonas sp. SFZ2018-12]MCH4895042.1 NAD-dependent epimerase/dehydratase family protein [Sphingomonas sp. SFZ2018-12]